MKLKLRLQMRIIINKFIRNNMLASRKARFNAVQLSNQERSSPSRHPEEIIGKIVTKNSRHRIEKDSEEEDSVEKKKSVSYGAGPSLNYSDLYKEIKINKKVLPPQINTVEHWLPRMQGQNHNQTQYVNSSNRQKQNQQNESRLSQSSKPNQEKSLNHNSLQKVFSISNYEIYKTPNINNTNKLKTIKTQQNNQQKPQQSKNTSVLPSISNKNDIKVSFQIEETDLPELNPSKIGSKQLSNSYDQQKDAEHQYVHQNQHLPDHQHLHEQQDAHDKQLQNLIGQQPPSNIQDHAHSDENISQFNLSEYSKIHDTLKNMQSILKSSHLNGQVDIQLLMREIKKYLEIIANGILDNIDTFDMPLHKKKIVKNALIYERVSIIVIAFAYATNSVANTLKYLINLLTYALNNQMLVIKVLETTEIKKNQNIAHGKSDNRLIIKKNFDCIRNNNDVILDSILKISKSEESFAENFKEILKLASKSSIQQTFYHVLQYFSFFLCVSELNHTIPFLSVAPNPYLQGESLMNKYTLVIDTVQVFCHGSKKSKTHVFRPHTEHFLYQMSQYYEIISFTNAFPSQIDKVIDFMDPKHCIKHRLYRHHSIQKGNYLIKSIDRIGRDGEKVIVLDGENNKVVGEAELAPNTLFLPLWRGNKNDTALAQLSPILAMIALKKLNCYTSIRKIQEQQKKNQSMGVKYFNFGINLD